MTNVPPNSEDQSSSVAALGLRWAALRGMLASPLINADDQKSLRDDLLRELRTVERSIGSIEARNTFEVSAKIDVIKEALKHIGFGDTGWGQDLLESIRRDVMNMAQSVAKNDPRQPGHPMRPVGRSMETPTPAPAPQQPPRSES
ncbi:MAG: hypothetical protein KF735_04615 [Chelatococcus sp.]|jgi:hypothetical protein|uniref:hypothetical protein n=1 Tax=unclassified Chelatococcus TaxID=2638111 RepID=UPI001BCB1A60|nr:MULTISPECIES: hypothetical protein [unclassified Chelatococcus]CAH1662408.1 conserved hypothetical protein [Hyphomicrobiales bacterium]MBS7696305.1 hypothetical protein [Chelatococcus sp. YT9]MBS7741378.1 hypothetical protein [Chelatococcus sp. HY11]MBX3536893.1 hypothetical protein [Chelatococcus sp.]MBX3546140.1 hypothetical protein [Chelatococcus sp.]